MALVAALPLLLLIALGVAVTSPGPVLFRQRRLGVNGRHFWCYKFRSMVHDAESVLDHDPKLKSLFSENFKLRHDPRVTRFGAFLRESSLDELPQFFNVLKGDMTLIGPRPIVPDELAKYGSFDTKLLTVTPGLTGLWQILGRSDTSYAERVALDMLYIDHQSLALDLKIMWMTWGAVLRRKGAC
jgi:lipopolysaccharide/colanic/teichoic acid biosynthesis glycosyltransferase